MRKITTFYIMILLVGAKVFAYIDLKDGEYHLVSNETHKNNVVRVDYNRTANPITQIEIADGGWVRDVRAYNNSVVSMSGGLVSGGLDVYDNVSLSMTEGSVGWFSGNGKSTVTISDGSLGISYLNDNSALTMTGGLFLSNLYVNDAASVSMGGGTIKDNFYAGDNSTVTLSGGSVGWRLNGMENGAVVMDGGTVGSLNAFGNATITMTGGLVGVGFDAYGLRVFENGTIYLDGSEFSVGSHTLSTGDKLSNFGIFDDAFNGHYTGTITGTMADGSPLETVFYIYNTGSNVGVGDIIVIPEPSMLLLMGIGGLMLRHKK